MLQLFQTTCSQSLHNSLQAALIFFFSFFTKGIAIFSWPNLIKSPIISKSNLVFPDSGDGAGTERKSESTKRIDPLPAPFQRIGKVCTFIREIRQYATIQELDHGILNRLISRILVGKVKKIDGEKFQEIEIIYNFVGEIPAITE